MITRTIAMECIEGGLGEMCEARIELRGDEATRRNLRRAAASAGWRTSHYYAGYEIHYCPVHWAALGTALERGAL